MLSSGLWKGKHAVNSRRLLKAGEAIREVVSTSILTEVRDPRVQNVTVLGVEVMPDMREARVYVSIMGSPAQQKTALHGLQNSAGFLQQRIADRIDTRYTPKLTFKLDDGIKKSIAVSEILEQIAQEQRDKEAQTHDADHTDADHSDVDHTDVDHTDVDHSNSDMTDASVDHSD